MLAENEKGTSCGKDRVKSTPQLPRDASMQIVKRHPEAET